MNKKIMTKLGDICKILDNYRGPLYPKTKDKLIVQDNIDVDNYVPFYKSTDLKDGFIEGSNSYITKEKFESIPFGKIDPGAIVLSFLGRIDIAFLKYKRGLMSSQLREIVITSPEKVDKEWFFYWLKNQIESDNNFANHWSTNVMEKNTILNMEFLLPPIEEQIDVVEKIHLIQELIDKYNDKFSKIWSLLNKLASLKDNNGELLVLKPVLKNDNSQEKLSKFVSFKTGSRVKWCDADFAMAKANFIDAKYFVTNKVIKKVDKENNFKFGDIGLLLTTYPGLIRLDLKGFSDIVFNVNWKEKYKQNSKLLLLFNLFNPINKNILKQFSSGSSVIRSLAFKKESFAFKFNESIVDKINILKDDKVIDYIVTIFEKRDKLIQIKNEIISTLCK